jgi:hypothetical protein
MMEKENQPTEQEMALADEYGAEETVAAHTPFVKFVGYVMIAQTLGLLACIAVYDQYADIEGVQGVMLASGMIFGIGMATTIAAYVIFRTVIAMSNESIAMREAAGGDGYRITMAREKNAEAMKRAKNGFKLLNFSGVCFVASALIGISGLISL